LGVESLEPRLVLATTLLIDDFASDTPGQQPASADTLFSANGPDGFVEVAGPFGTYGSPFGGIFNNSLVIDNPGNDQPIVGWSTIFSDNPADFQSGSISFDLYITNPDPTDDWGYIDIRLGYGGGGRSVPTTVGDTTVWNSFRINASAADIVFDNGNGSGQSTIAGNTKMSVLYEINSATQTYRLSIGGSPVDFGTGNPDRPWTAGAPGINMMGFFGAFGLSSSAVYIDNLEIIGGAEPPPPWVPPTSEPTDRLEWHQHRGNQRLTGEATVTEDIINGAGVIWSQAIGARESWVGLAPNGGGAATTTLPTSNVSISQSELISWDINGPYFDLSQNGNLVAESTSSLKRIGDFIPGNGVLEKLEGEVFNTTTGEGVIRLFTYNAGTWVQQWQSPQIPAMFSIPNLIVGDFDNDTQLEVALTPWTNLYLLNMATGQIEQTETFKPPANQSGRPYGWLGAYDLTGDNREEFILMGDFQDFITVMGWDGGGNIVKLWDYVIEPNLSGKQTAHRPVAFPVRDITGDNQPEIVTSIFNDSGDERWHLVVFDSLTGSFVHDLIDHAIDGARDVNGDGDYELFVRATQGALLPPSATTKILDWNGSGFDTLWSDAGVGFVSQPIPDFPVFVNSATATGKVDLLTGAIDEGGEELFFTSRILDASTNEKVIEAWQMDGAGGFTSLGTATGTNLDALAVRETTGSTASILLSTEVVGAAAGTVDQIGFDGQVTFSTGGGPPRSSAVVGRLGGPSSLPTVVVQGGSESITALQPAPNGDVDTVWTRAGIGGFTGATQFQGQHQYSGVALADVTGDGLLETLYATHSETGQARLVAADSTGGVVWQTDFDVPGGTRVWNQPGLTLWRAGNFTDTGHQDVLVQIMRGSGGTGEFHLLDGQTGELIWMREFGNTPGTGATQRNAGEAHMAVYDWDGDGLDEAVNFHPDMFYVVDGDGTNLVDKSVLGGGVFPDGSPLYATPIVADFLDNGTDTILFAGSYSQFGLTNKNGTALWFQPFTLDNTPGMVQGVGDVDNDGDLDLLSPGHPIAPTVDTDSEFHAYDAATGNLLWKVDLPGRPYAPVGGAYFDSPTLSVSGDIDGDGRVESLFAIADTLYVVGADPGGTSGSIEWTFRPDGGQLGSPIIADANGDGQAEIIVVSNTGKVYGIGQAPVSALVGDFNLDNRVNADDIDLLMENLGSINLLFDLNDDMIVDSKDVDELVLNILDTQYGDANLDGVTDGVDFWIWQANRFQPGTGWATANFNGDTGTDVRDMNLWNANKFLGSGLADGSAEPATERTPRAALATESDSVESEIVVLETAPLGETDEPASRSDAEDTPADEDARHRSYTVDHRLARWEPAKLVRSNRRSARANENTVQPPVEFNHDDAPESF